VVVIVILIIVKPKSSGEFTQWSSTILLTENSLNNTP